MLGKTTLLRDIVKQISNGIKEIEFNGINVGVVDERGEIAALYKGMPQNDIGIKTDVIDNVSKANGIKMLVRSMAPKVVVADEIGKKEDVDAINYAISSGVKGIFSAHGNCLEDLKINNILKSLIENYIFEIIIFLDIKEKGKIKQVFFLDKYEMKYKNKEIYKKLNVM